MPYGEQSPPHMAFYFLLFANYHFMLIVEARENIKTLCTQNGGQYSSDLNKKCTHLVVEVLFAKCIALKLYGVY